MELEFITAGRIVNTHGVRGEVKVLPQGVEPDLLAQCAPLYVDGRPLSPAACREHKGCLLVKLQGVDSMDAALALKGKDVSIRRESARPGPPADTLTRSWWDWLSGTRPRAGTWGGWRRY